MARKLLSCFRLTKVNSDPKQKVFEAVKRGDAVSLGKVLHKLDCTQRIYVLDKQYIADPCSLPGKEKPQVTPLVVAVQNGNLDCVKVLLKYGADIDGRDDMFKHITKGSVHVCQYEGCIPLFVAASSGNVEILSCLLDNGADMNAITNTKDYTVTPLIVAVRSGNLECGKVLLKFGADIEGRGDFNYVSKAYPFHSVSFGGCTPLFVAAVNGNVVILRCFTKNGADINAVTNFKGYTPLMMATRYNHLAAVTFLSDQGADANLQDKKGYTALHYFSKFGNICHFRAISCLINNGADVNAQRADDNLTPLMLACKCQNVETINYLLQNGAQVGLQDKYGQTCLQYAVKRGVDGTAFEILSSLIKIGADVNARKEHDQTLLMQATLRGDLKLVTLLIEHGAKVDLQDRNGDTAFQYAQHARHNADEIICALLTAGECNLCNRSALTHLPRAYSNNEYVGKYEHEYLMKLVLMVSKLNCGEDGKVSRVSHLFLKTVCNLNPRDLHGNTLLHKCVIDHYTNAMKLLLKAGVNINSINSSGDTPLHLAVIRKDSVHFLPHVLEVLFDGGAHIDFVNNDGKTPMDMAETDEARMILSERRKLELKCISARAVKKLGIPYMGVVPKTLEKYISMH